MLMLREINIHSKLKHEHVVEFIESFEDEHFIYIIQFLCSNQSLWELRKLRGNLTIAECRYFVSQTLKAVEYIHSEGYIHRDIKPSNILIDSNMQIKLTDFGLSISREMKQSGSICGTLNYLSPEVVMGKGANTKSDIWATGVVAFFLHFGFKPFDEDDRYDEKEIYNRICNVDYR